MMILMVENTTGDDDLVCDQTADETQNTTGDDDLAMLSHHNR